MWSNALCVGDSPHKKIKKNKRQSYKTTATEYKVALLIFPKLS